MSRLASRPAAALLSDDHQVAAAGLVPLKFGFVLENYHGSDARDGGDGQEDDPVQVGVQLVDAIVPQQIRALRRRAVVAELEERGQSDGVRQRAQVLCPSQKLRNQIDLNEKSGKQQLGHDQGRHELGGDGGVLDAAPDEDADARAGNGQHEIQSQEGEEALLEPHQEKGRDQLNDDLPARRKGVQTRLKPGARRVVNTSEFDPVHRVGVQHALATAP